MPTAYQKTAKRERRLQSREWLRTGFRLLAITLAALQVWAAIRSGSMNADGIVYLDIGDAYWHGNWQDAVNPVWSPLYSWILGAAMALVRPAMAWEFALVHLVNLLLYVLALWCFEFFWRQLDLYRRMNHDPDSHTLPAWAWWAVGYSLFIWTALTLINVWAVTPDMLMAALVLLAAGLVTRLRLAADGWLQFVLLGLVLGLAYLSKAIMFPLAFTFLAVALFASGDLRRAVPRTLVALFTFLLISVPFIAAISRNHGSLTFGEAGTITYLRYVNGIPYPHWQGKSGEYGRALHPSRQVFDTPPIYEFGEPIAGTYPISYNPIYWYEGATVQFDLVNQLRAVMRSSSFYLDLFTRQQGGFLVLVSLLHLAASRPFTGTAGRLSVQNYLRRWGLLLPAVAASSMYALVYVEGRYVGVFVILFWSAWLANVRLPNWRSGAKLVRISSGLMIAFLMGSLLAFYLDGYGRLQVGDGVWAAPPAKPVEVAETLHDLGVGEGSNVGVIGYAFDSYWARLARVQIVAEMLDSQADPFWVGAPSLQEASLRAFERSGACAVVAEYVPAYARLPGWQQVGASNYYIYLFPDCN